MTVTPSENSRQIKEGEWARKYLALQYDVGETLSYYVYHAHHLESVLSVMHITSWLAFAEGDIPL